MLVAGRNPGKATEFCAQLPNSTPVAADRTATLQSVFSAHQPDVVIDAAGPFQESDYRLPLACIHAAVPYVDLADARGFVVGIGAVDEIARVAGVAIVSGASSVPALSGAVARHLADGMDQVTIVEIAISASNRATAGASVAAAILSYVGTPLRLWRGRRWNKAWGWQDLRRETFRVQGARALPNRWIALADVPDHDLLPEMLPGRPAVIFRAGTEHAAQTIGLWLLSWPIRWFSLDSLARFAPWLLPLQRLTRKFSSDRSAMSVRLKGKFGGSFVQRQWTLIAEDGSGPEIPTLAATLLAEAVAAGAVPPGAHDAGRLLTIDRFEPLFRTLSVRRETREQRLPLPLYQRVMGERYQRLPTAVRAIHDVCGDAGASGEAVVSGSRSRLARLVALIMRFPRPGVYPLHVAFAEQGGIECWTRFFGDQRFRSYLSEHRGLLIERFGPLRFRFDLHATSTGLDMRMKGWSVLGLPLPLALAPRSPAREWQEGERFRFDVPISLPVIGSIVRYSGWLIPAR